MTRENVLNITFSEKKQDMKCWGYISTLHLSVSMTGITPNAAISLVIYVKQD